SYPLTHSSSLSIVTSPQNSPSPSPDTAASHPPSRCTSTPPASTRPSPSSPDAAERKTTRRTWLSNSTATPCACPPLTSTTAPRPLTSPNTTTPTPWTSSPTTSKTNL